MRPGLRRSTNACGIRNWGLRCSDRAGTSRCGDIPETIGNKRDAQIARHPAEKGYRSAAVDTPSERQMLDALQRSTGNPPGTLSDLTLPEITAQSRRSSIIVGN
ncbi:MAG: hypothetical protein IPM63_10695 [Acidobacteriota bacterium]|nr:MAG: hypothetical protein IPM63_10695 [Acidobacteriota bacterium]